MSQLQAFFVDLAQAYYGPEKYAKQLSLFDQPVKPKPKMKSVASISDLKPSGGDNDPAQGWIRMKGDRGATYWYNRTTNPNNRPEGRIYQDSPPTKGQAKSTGAPRTTPTTPTVPGRDVPVMKQEQDQIRKLVSEGKQVPGSLARKHVEVLKEATAKKEAEQQAQVQKERQQVRQALSEGRKVSPELAERHSDLVRVAESHRKQRLAQDPERKAETAKPRSIHKPPEERLKTKFGEAVPKSGHIGIKEFPGKKFKYTIQNPNIANIPSHHDVLESRLVESNNELFRVSIVGTSHGKFYSQIEVGDIVDSAPSKQTVEFRPATPAETKVISSKTDTQSPVAALERKMWKANRDNWRSEASEKKEEAPIPGMSQRELFAHAHAFAEAVCEKYAPRWNVGTHGRHTRGRPSPGQKSFEFAAEEHANILRLWDFNEEVKHPRGGDGRWVKKHGAEQSDKPAPLFEHEKIDDIAELFQGDQPVNPKQVAQILGDDWIDRDTAKQVMGKLGIGEHDQEQQAAKMFQDMKSPTNSIMVSQFASQLSIPKAKGDIDYSSVRNLFYDGDRLRLYPAKIEDALGTHVNKGQAIRIMREVGADDEVIQATMEDVFNGDDQVESEWFGWQFYNQTGEHDKRKRWEEVSRQIPGDASVIVFARENSPHEEKLILHPSTYTKGTWQLSRRDKDGPVGHTDHKTREAGLRAAIGVADHHLDNEGDASYKLLWHNKSGEKAPFTLRTGRLQGAAVEFYSQALMNLYGPERYAKQLSLFEPAKPAAGKAPDPEHHLKHVHRPAGSREGGQFAPKPKTPEAPLRDPAEGLSSEERRAYYRDHTKKATKRTKKWDPNRPTTPVQQEVNDVAEDILNAANAGESISPDAQSKFSKRIGGYIRKKVNKTELQPTDRDDVVQNVFLKVWDKLTNVYESGRWNPQEGPFTRWLGTVVSRAITDQIRFVEDRQGREQRGKAQMSALVGESDEDQKSEFEERLTDREYRAAFSPEQWRGFMDKLFSLGVQGLDDPLQHRAVELWFGYDAPGELPMQNQSAIAKRIAFERERRWDKESSDQDLLARIDDTTLKRIRRKIGPTLQDNGALWTAIRKMEELGRLDLDELYDSPAEWMKKGDYSLHEHYAMAYLLHKHRYHMADFLQRPERYILAELTTPERYSRPFDETKIQRGAKGDPQGKGGQFAPKHGGGGVEASDPHGSMTTATPSAAPSVPRLTPPTPARKQGTSTVQSAVVLALLAAGALSGKRGLGAIAGVAMPHLTKTMRTQAKQAREVLKQDPHSDFGKQLAESARKIDAQLKATEGAKQKKEQKERRDKLAERRLKMAEKLAPAKEKAAKEQAVARLARAEAAKMKAEIAKQLLPEYAKAEEAKAKAKRTSAESRQFESEHVAERRVVKQKQLDEAAQIAREHWEHNKHSPQAAKKAAKTLGTRRHNDIIGQAATRKAANEWGMPAEDYKALADEAWATGDLDLKRDRENAKQDARRFTNLNRGAISKLINTGHDFASMDKAQFDVVYSEIASNYPSLGWDPDEAGGHLVWDLIGEGAQEVPGPHMDSYHDRVANYINAKRPDIVQALEQSNYGDEDDMGDAFEPPESEIDESWEPDEPSKREDDVVPFSMHRHARRELYSQVASAYYGGKV